MFELPFDEIVPMVGRTPAAARQLASRARRRAKGVDIPASDPDVSRQRAVVDAFFPAARDGDFDALVAVLDPDVALRSDFGAKHPPCSVVIRGAAAVARQARAVPGSAGATVVHGKIVEIDAIADPERVRRIAATVLSDE